MIKRKRKHRAPPLTTWPLLGETSSEAFHPAAAPNRDTGPAQPLTSSTQFQIALLPLIRAETNEH